MGETLPTDFNVPRMKEIFKNDQYPTEEIVDMCVGQNSKFIFIIIFIIINSMAYRTQEFNAAFTRVLQ